MHCVPVKTLPNTFVEPTDGQLASFRAKILNGEFIYITLPLSTRLKFTIEPKSMSRELFHKAAQKLLRISYNEKRQISSRYK